jgi:hypothetical protein
MPSSPSLKRAMPRHRQCGERTGQWSAAGDAGGAGSKAVPSGQTELVVAVLLATAEALEVVPAGSKRADVGRTVSSGPSAYAHVEAEPSGEHQSQPDGSPGGRSSSARSGHSASSQPSLIGRTAARPRPLPCPCPWPPWPHQARRDRPAWARAPCGSSCHPGRA